MSNIHKDYFVVKKLVENICIKAFWYTNHIIKSKKKYEHYKSLVYSDFLICVIFKVKVKSGAQNKINKQPDVHQKIQSQQTK